jgi:PPOX class probable F420-dependent enzyme
VTVISPEIRAFLTAGTRTGKVGFVAADGRPLVAPVWFVLAGPDDAPELVFTTNTRSSKGRAIARDPRLTICVDDERPPYAYVQVQGVVAVSEDLDELVRTATAIAHRYMGPDRAEEFGRRNAAPGELVVRLRPTKIVAEMNVTG